MTSPTAPSETRDLPAGPRPPGGLSLAQKLTYTFILVALLGMGSELAARLDDYFRAGVPLLASPSFADLVLVDSLGPRGTPGGHVGEWQLNSAGFRSSESVLTPRPGCVRVMTIGASETFGSGSEGPPGGEYPAQLADSLATHGCYQVMNAAIVGMSLRGMIQFWDSWASRYHPKIVVVLAAPAAYLSNSAPAFPSRRASPPPRFGNWWNPRLASKLHGSVHYPDFIQRQRVQNLLTALTAGHSADWFFASVPTDRLQQYRSDLDSLLTTIRAHGSEPVLADPPIRFGRALMPDDSTLMSGWRQFTPRAGPSIMLAFQYAANEVVRDVARDRGVTLVDLARVMNGRADLFDDAVHFTKKGASVAARDMTSAVLEMNHRVPKSAGSPMP